MLSPEPLLLQTFSKEAPAGRKPCSEEETRTLIIQSGLCVGSCKMGVARTLEYIPGTLGGAGKES